MVHFAFQPTRDSEGNVTGLLVIAHDVTTLVAARKNVEVNEMRLQALANSLPQVVWTAEGDGTVTYYNDKVRGFSGARRTESGNWEWEGVLHPDDLQPTVDAWTTALKNKTLYQIEHRVKMKDGNYRWHLSRAYPYEIDGSVKWYGTATDVHDQKVLEMNLENLVKERTLELERSNDDLQQFAHVASHDLKEPVRKVKTFAYKLREEFQTSLGERGNVLIGKILSATDRMYAMINGVLDYASLQSKDNEVQKVDLNVVIKNIATDLEVLVSEKNAEIQVDKLPVVAGNSDLLYQLFYNLINNSLKFAKENVPSRIQITSQLKDRYHAITLSDNGIGFDQQYADQIFTTFFRLNAKDKYEGTGLGLALCKKIVENYGGFITARGEKNIGAQFLILLPI